MNSENQNSKRSDMAIIFKKPAFLVLWLSETFSLIGDRLVMVAFLQLVYKFTQSSASIGALMALKGLPAFVIGSFVGVLIDRFNKKRVMIISNLIQGLMVILIPFTDSLALLFSIYFLMSGVNLFFVPARAATIPEIIPLKQLMTANSLFAISYVGAIAIGPAIAAFIIESSGLNAAFYVDSLTFLIPAVAVMFIKLKPKKNLDSKFNFLSEMKEGFKYIKSNLNVKIGLVSLCLAYLTIGFLTVLGVVISDKILKTGTGGYGYLMSSLGVGLLIGAIVTSRSGKGKDIKMLSIIGSLVMGSCFIVLPYISNIYLSLSISAIIGFGIAIVQICNQTIFQTVKEELRGRVQGLAQAVTGGVSVVGMGLSGYLAEQIGVQLAISLEGIVVIITTLGLLAVIKKKSVGEAN